MNYGRSLITVKGGKNMFDFVEWTISVDSYHIYMYSNYRIGGL